MAAPLRKPFFTLALAASLVVGVTSAQAVSLPIPNSGFETPCSLPQQPTFPCNWGGTSGSQVTWDNTIHHVGNASLALHSIGTPGIVALSSCVTPASPSTTYNLEIWYRTTAAVSFISMGFNTYTSTDCTGSPFGPATSATTMSPNTTGNWARLTGQSATGANDHSLKVMLSFTCASTCASGLIVNLDDVLAQTEPLAVTMTSFAARLVAHGVLLRWHTGTEADLLGFHVYRTQGHSWRRVTHSLVAAKGLVPGASYRFLDRTAKRAVSYRYRLRAINSDGTASWFGPVRVT
jgi:hypothetical protein